MSVSTDDVIEVVSFGLWWPDGEPGELRERARAWRAMAAALAAAHDELLSAAEEVRFRSEGAAVDAYAEHSRRLRDHLLDVAEACQSLARDLDSFADELDEARRQVMQMAAEIAATVAVGIGLAVLTVGLSAGASAAVTGAMVARAGLLARFVGQRAVEIAARTAATALVGAAEGAAADLLVQTVPQLTFTDNANPFDQVDLDLHQLGVATAGGGILGGAFGGVRAVRAPRLPQVGAPAFRGVRGLTGPERPGLMPLDQVGEVSERIGRGHAFPKHVLERGEMQWVSSEDDLVAFVRRVLTEPDDVTSLPRGRSAHWDAETATIVIHDPGHADLGTVFQPGRGYDFFLDRRREGAEALSKEPG